MTDDMSLRESIDWQRLQEQFESQQSRCRMCIRCHPGRQWGGPDRCRVTDCRCHS
jgi:hypothetical protein